MPQNKPSPCESCKSRQQLRRCRDGRCARWREWWIARWDEIHNYWLKYGKQ